MSSFSEYTPEQLLFMYQQQFGPVLVPQNVVNEELINQSELEALDELREEGEEESAFTSFMKKNGVFGVNLKNEVAEHMSSWRQMRAELKDYERKLLSGPSALTRNSTEFKFLSRRFAEGQRLVDVEGLTKDSPEYNEALADWELENDEPERTSTSFSSSSSSVASAAIATTSQQVSSSTNLSLAAPSFVPNLSTSLPLASNSNSSFHGGVYYDEMPGGGGGGGYGSGQSSWPNEGGGTWTDQQQYYHHSSYNPSLDSTEFYSAPQAASYNGGAAWMAENAHQQYATGHHSYPYSSPPPPPYSSTANASSDGSEAAFAMAELLRGLVEADQQGRR
jgi:hypothetical protein